MDSDGHKPRLPEKVSGVWEKNKKGNPYNVHLCQRPLLEDLKLLLRSVGVESVIRGPYRSGENKKGEDTISYRLDLNRRMYERNVEGRENVHHPKFHDMHAPQFLVNALLDSGIWVRSDFPDESSYNLYLRLKTGGRASVYTLRRLCQILKVELPVPIYGFKRLVSKKSLGQEEHTYTLSVRDSLHRFEADGVISKNSGADILKISLVRLLKELYKKGWLKNGGGDDSVRMIMTIHDEIVFEIRNDRLQEAVPMISSIMESPSEIVGWKVPLIVEPLLGQSWDAKHDWDAIMAGKKPIPDWLEGVLQVGPAREPVPFSSPSPDTSERKAPAPPRSPTSSENPQIPEQEVTKPAKEEKSALKMEKPKVSISSSPQPQAQRAQHEVLPIAEFRIARAYMTRQSVFLVTDAILKS